MFLINLQGKDSIYEQIRSQIEKFIKTGILKPDDKLPSVRSLAAELGINPNTVMKAYQELERNGYIYTLNKKGVFVAGFSDVKTQKDQADALKILQTLKEEGFTKTEVVSLLEKVYEEATC